MTNGDGWACRLETGVATVVGDERGGGGFHCGKGGGGSGRCGYGICIGRVGKKSMGDSESIRNLFEQVEQGRGKLTINGLCLSFIAPLLMEKIEYLPP